MKVQVLLGGANFAQQSAEVAGDGLGFGSDGEILRGGVCNSGDCYIQQFVSKFSSQYSHCIQPKCLLSSNHRFQPN
jgi:hypothetical protein